MPKKRTWNFTVSEGGDVPHAVWLSAASEAALYAGRQAKLTMEPPPRSNQANRYYWGLVLPQIRLAALDTGQTVSCEALHEHFKRLYLDPEVSSVNGVEIRVYTTKNLDSTQFYDYVENIRSDEMVLGLGCYIPDPETKQER